MENCQDLCCNTNFVLMSSLLDAVLLECDTWIALKFAPLPFTVILATLHPFVTLYP